MAGAGEVLSVAAGAAAGEVMATVAFAAGAGCEGGGRVVRLDMAGLGGAGCEQFLLLHRATGGALEANPDPGPNPDRALEGGEGGRPGGQLQEGGRPGWSGGPGGEMQVSKLRV
jgi:hypothetical protein